MATETDVIHMCFCRIKFLFCSVLFCSVTLYLAELLSLFDQPADLLLSISLFNSTFAKGEVNIQHK